MADMDRSHARSAQARGAESAAATQYRALRGIRDGAISFEQAGIVCQGCTPRARCRLGVQLRRDDALDGVSGTVTVPPEWAGGPGVAHGGLVLAALEEILGSVHTSAGLLAVTVQVEVSLRRPVPVGSPIAAWGRLVAVLPDGRRTADATLETDKVLATATGESMVRDPDRHFRWANDPNR